MWILKLWTKEDICKAWRFESILNNSKVSRNAANVWILKIVTDKNQKTKVVCVCSWSLGSWGRGGFVSGQEFRAARVAEHGHYFLSSHSAAPQRQRSQTGSPYHLGYVQSASHVLHRNEQHGRDWGSFLSPSPHLKCMLKKISEATCFPLPALLTHVLVQVFNYST